MEKEFKRVGTHSGRFHADEVMSTAILQELFDLEVIRSRDPEVLSQLDFIYDVGEGEFDHHQAEKRYRESGTPYAACGLIWDRFGRDVVRMREPALSEEEAEHVFQRVEDMLIEGIDAVDNGVKTGVTFIPTMGLSSMVAEFNPPWDSDVENPEAFLDAVDLASKVLVNMLQHQISTVKARNLVKEAFETRTQRQLLVLDQPYPWSRLLYEMDTGDEILFVIFPKDGEYLLQTVRKNDGTYGDRKRLPRSWAGKRDGELAGITGVQDAGFCHEARFIASAKSLEGALKMAELALAEPVYVKKKSFADKVKGFFFKKRIRIRIK